MGTPTNATQGATTVHTLTITNDDAIPDTTAPSGSISINSNASYTNSANVSLSLSATDTIGVTGYYLSTSNLTPSASSTGWTAITSNISYLATVPYTLNTGDGAKTLYCWYKDSANNISTSSQDAITLDATSPTITISSPTSGSTLSATVTISASATDSSGISGVSFKLDGASLGQEDATSPYELSWDTTTAAKGSHSLTAIVTDGAGNTTTSSPITLTVNNNHAPILSEVGNKVVDENKELSFSISATDQDNDILTYAASGLPEGSSFIESTKTFIWIPNYTQSGTHKVSFSVSDTELSDSKEITITVNDVDVTVPTITITSPTTDTTYSITSSALSLSGTASDDTTLYRVTWTSDQGGSGIATLTDNVWGISNITLISGPNLITVTATDSNTNTSTDTLTVTYTPITDTTLKASYSFDQSSGSTLTDSSGNNYNGTITGATWTSGKVGSGALSFNGTSDYVAIPRMNYDEITISAWFYKNADDLTSADAIFGGWRWNSSVSLQEGLDLRFPINSPDTISIVMVTTDGTAKFSKSSYYNFGSGKANNAWHHVAVTYNKADGNQRLYVDGVLRDTDLHAAGNTIVPLAAYTDMRIGHSRVNNGYFNGTIDDLKVYSRAISEEEITDLYNYQYANTSPLTETFSSTSITNSSAILNALVNPNYLDTEVWLEYGTEKGVYGKNTANKQISGYKAVMVSLSVEGLSNNTTYYYRAVAQNSKGTSYGREYSFITSDEGDEWKNIYGIAWKDTPANQLKYAKQMGYKYIGISRNSYNISKFTTDPNSSGIKFYFIDPFSGSHKFDNNDQLISDSIDTTKSYTQAQIDWYNRNMAWKDNTKSFPDNLANGWYHGGDDGSAVSTNFRVMPDLQQDRVLNAIVEEIITDAEAFENTETGFQFAGYMIDVFNLKGDFAAGRMTILRLAGVYTLVCLIGRERIRRFCIMA